MQAAKAAWVEQTFEGHMRGDVNHAYFYVVRQGEDSVLPVGSSDFQIYFVDYEYDFVCHYVSFHIALIYTTGPRISKKAL